MSAGTYNLCIDQGATYSRVFTWSAGTCCGVGTAGAAPAPVDLTGYTVLMQIRPYALSTTLYYDASTVITLGGTAGTITLTIPEATTETFAWWSGVYDMILTSAGGIATRLLQGTVTVSPGVTT